MTPRDRFLQLEALAYLEGGRTWHMRALVDQRLAAEPEDVKAAADALYDERHARLMRALDRTPESEAAFRLSWEETNRIRATVRASLCPLRLWWWDLREWWRLWSTRKQRADRQARMGKRCAEALAAASDARQRALAALSTGGGLAAQEERLDFDRAAARAESLRAIARFNAEQSEKEEP